MLMVSLIRWECQLVGLGLYNAFAKPIAYVIQDRSHLLEISPPPRWRWRSHLAKPIAYVIQVRSPLLVLAHGVDDAPDRRRCTAATATTHDKRCGERCWRPDGALVGKTAARGGKLRPPFAPPYPTVQRVTGAAVPIRDRNMPWKLDRGCERASGCSQ